MMVSQAGGGGVGARCVPRAKFRRGKPEKGQEDRGRGPVTRISKSETVYLLRTPREVPGLHLHVRMGEVDQPGMKEKKIESRSKEMRKQQGREGKKNQGEKTQAPSLPQARLPPTMKALQTTLHQS